MFMTANMNGWDAEERELRQPQGRKEQRRAGGMAGPRVRRWHRLRTLLKSNGVDVLAVQEHHCEQQVGESKQQAEERLEKGIPQFKWIHWESASILADTQNSGLVSFWRKDKFNMVAKYELEQMVLVTVLQDDDGVQWTVVNVHFHNDAGPRRLHWTMIKEKVPKYKRGI